MIEGGHSQPYGPIVSVMAAYGDIGVGSAIARQQAQFYNNEARPSAVLSTDMRTGIKIGETQEQMDQRQQFNMNIKFDNPAQKAKPKQKEHKDG